MGSRQRPRCSPTPTDEDHLPFSAQYAWVHDTSVTMLISNTIARRFSSESRAVGTHVTTSSLFIPSKKPPLQDATVQSHKLMLQAGLLRQSSSGVHTLLPLGLRALEKLVGMVDWHMRAVGGVKVALPVLTPAALWKTSGRWQTVGPELFRLQDQKQSEYCLGPTHEEVVTDLVARELSSHRQLPLRIYQLDRKFRDEIRPRFGLLRGKEFWMKDLYSFDVSEEKAVETYAEICSAYEKLFSKLELPVVKVKADVGNIGGSLSHEYHVTASVGEDTIVRCHSCGAASSRDLLGEEEVRELSECPDAGREGKACHLEEIRGIEVAHAFVLGTKYSEVFKAAFTDKDNQEKLCQMGCYGIGVSRLLQAVIEHGCSHQQERLVWPPAIAPYYVCVAPLKQAKYQSSESDTWLSHAEELCSALQQVCPGEVLLEDRTYLSVGARLRALELTGCPNVIILGQKTPAGQYELHLQKRDAVETHILDKNCLLDLLANTYKELRL